MLPKLAAACTVVALSVSPCFGQSWGRSDLETKQYSLSNTVRRAWQTDARRLVEIVTANHPRSASRCSNRTVDVTETIQCFHRLIAKHFLRQVLADSSQLRSWCLDDANPRHCLESLAAQEVEQWRYNRTMAAPPAAADPNRIVSR